MKEFEVTYTRGGLFDTATGRRVKLKDDSAFILKIDEGSFDFVVEQTRNISGQIRNLLDREKILHDPIIDKSSKRISEFCLKRGAILQFHVRIRNFGPEGLVKKFKFSAELHEDLYMYSEGGAIWKLESCVCSSQPMTDEGLIFDSVVGKSLNNLFVNVVSKYFHGQRGTSCNAFDTFHYGTSPLQYYREKLELKYYGKLIRDPLKFSASWR